MKLRAQEEHLDEMREDLTRTLVHDLRSPLSSILASLEVLSRTALTSEQSRMVQIAQSNGERLLRLVSSILDVDRLESGAMPLERQRVPLGPLVAETLERQRPLAAAKKLRLASGVPEDLPDAWVDRDVVSRVLENLVSNAVKFTPLRGTVQVEARVGTEPGFLEAAVVDSGPGVPPDMRPRLFQKFATGRQAGRGSGLGLAFCRLAVEAHGGKIWVEDAPQGGAVFRFTLPAAAPEAGLPPR